MPAILFVAGTGISLVLGLAIWWASIPTHKSDAVAVRVLRWVTIASVAAILVAAI